MTTTSNYGCIAVEELGGTCQPDENCAPECPKNTFREPVKAWAIFDSDGEIDTGTIESHRSDSMYYFLMHMGEKKEWPFYYNRGYRCRKIRIEVD